MQKIAIRVSARWWYLLFTAAFLFHITSFENGETVKYSIPPLLRGLWDERKIREKPRKSGGPRNSGDVQKAPGYGILAIILSKTSGQVFS